MVLVVFVVALVAGRAQMDISLQKLADSPVGTVSYRHAKKLQHQAPGESVVVLAKVKDGHALPEQTLINMGVKVRGNYGKVAVLAVPVNRLKTVVALDAIEYLQSDRKHRVQNDLARIDMQVEDVQKPNAAFDKIYDGTGVLVGVVDVGIDFQHPAFRNADGSTRIKMAQIYDTHEGEHPADMAAVRQTFTTPEEIALLTTDSEAQTHGSHTSCTAAGSPVTLSDGTLIQGMAPKAELLLSAMHCDDGETYDSYAMDAIDSQVAYAKKVGKPIVINNSYGDISVYNDGKSLFSTFEESLAGPGRIFCFSTGNSNNKNYCIEYVPESDTDTLRTVFWDIMHFYREGVETCVVNEDDAPLEVKLSCVAFPSFETVPFGFYTLDGESVSLEQAVTKGKEPLHDNRYTVKLELPDGYAVEKSRPYFISLSVAGQKGKKIRVVNSVVLDGMGLPGYVNGGGVNSFSRLCESDSVISVGSYCSRPVFKNWTGKSYSSPVAKYEHSTFSSFGEMTTGKTIPDVYAPGEYLLSAFNACDTTLVRPATQEPIGDYVYTSVDMFGRKSWYGWMRGTSMSSPAAAGVIALWLQANPNLSVAEVRDIIEKTGENGMLRAENGLKYILSRYPSGIDEVKRAADDRIFNLHGLRVNENYRGLVIKNGKKYLQN